MVNALLDLSIDLLHGCWPCSTMIIPFCSAPAHWTHGANQYAKRPPPATRRLPRAAAPAAAPWAQQLLLPASSSMKICRHRHSSLQNARSPLHMHARATSQTDVRSTKRHCICELACQKIELATADQSPLVPKIFQALQYFATFAINLEY